MLHGYAQFGNAPAQRVKNAVDRSDLGSARSAFARAAELRPKYDAKKFAPLVQAVAKGVSHKDQEFSLAAVEALGELKFPGSGKHLHALLKPPAEEDKDRLSIHLAAIRAVGSIHDSASMKLLEKLLVGKRADSAAAAAQALVGYRNLDRKPRYGLMNRLVKVLEGLEKKIEKAGSDEARKDPARVRAALVETLGRLGDGASEDTAAGWTKWIRASKKADRGS